MSRDAWELAEFDGLGQAELVRRGSVSAAELVEAALCRLDDVNGVLNAVVARFDDIDRQLEAAAALPHSARFAGVPVLLKDLRVQYQDGPQSDGSRFVRGYRGKRDATLVARMKASGLVFIGRSGSSEFGAESETTLFGPTHNPWDLSRSPGGSSAGSAAAVAARIVPVAHGSDSGGSIRGPASRCGLFGLKPTRGRNPTGPDPSDSCGGLGVDHVLTWSVRDSAAVLDATNGPELGSFSMAPEPPVSYLGCVGEDPGALRIALSSESPDGQQVDEECRLAARRTADLCEQLGHVVEEATPTYDAAALVSSFDGLLCDLTAVKAATWAEVLGKPLRMDDFTPAVRLLIERGQRRTSVEHSMAVSRLQRAAREVAAFFADYDMLLTPTTPTPAIRHPPPPDPETIEEYWDREVGKGTFMLLSNITGQPAMSVPLHRSSHGLPVGSHFMARFGREDILLGLAGQLERSLPWSAAWPRLANRV